MPSDVPAEDCDQILESRAGFIALTRVLDDAFDTSAGARLELRLDQSDECGLCRGERKHGGRTKVSEMKLTSQVTSRAALGKRGRALDAARRSPSSDMTRGSRAIVSMQLAVS